MLNNVLEWLLANWVELTAFILGVIYVVLATKENAWCWLFGVLNVSVYIFIFFQAKLYGDMALQWLYLFMGIYGWLQWKNILFKHSKQLFIRKILPKTLMFVFISTIIIATLAAIILSYTDTDVPVFDGLLTSLGLVSTWLTAKKFLENWLFWIVANLLSLSLYIYKDLFITAAFYGILAILAYFGFLQWKKSMLQQN